MDLLLESSCGFGAKEFATRLILVPKNHLLNTLKRDQLGKELIRQRAGHAITKLRWETLVKPLLEKENPEPYAVHYIPDYPRVCKLLLGNPTSKEVMSTQLPK